MTRHAWIFLLAFLAVPVMACAGLDLGQFCWDFNENSDYLRVNVVQTNKTADTVNAPGKPYTPGELSSGLDTIDTLGVRWRATLNNQIIYQLVGTGLATPALDQEQFAWELDFQLSHATPFFGAVVSGRHNCTLHVFLDGRLSGPWFAECGPLFDASGTLSVIGCDQVDVLDDGAESFSTPSRAAKSPVGHR